MNGNMSLYSPQVVTTRHIALWAKSVSPAPNKSMFNSVCVDGSDIYAAGYINGNGLFTFGVQNAQSPVVANNIVLVKYNSSGAAQWAKTVSSGASNSIFNSLAVYSSGNVYAAGHIDGNGPFDFGSQTATGTNNIGNGYNIVLVKYNSSGAAQWAKTVVAGPNDSVF